MNEHHWYFSKIVEYEKFLLILQIQLFFSFLQIQICFQESID